MKKLVYACLVFLFMIIGSPSLGSQVVYGTYNFLGSTYLAAIDVSTCTVCNVLEIPFDPHSEVSILPDGRVILIGTQNFSNLSIYSPPSSIPSIISPSPPTFMVGSVYFNNLLYISAVDGLYYFDPTTDQVVFVGGWPAGFPTSVYLYEFGGQIFGVTIGVPSDIWQIDLNDPSNSVFVQSVSLPLGATAATSVNNEVFISTSFWLNSYDPTTNSYQQECNFPAMGINGFTGMTSLPPGLPNFPCLCVTDAGTVNNVLNEICLPNNGVVPYNGDATLDGDDLLQYILFSDLSDTLGSILYIGNTPNIPFNPATMQTGVTYYMATIAGNDLNGNVDLTDDCLSISNASEVIWWSQPSVLFSIANPNACAGQCITLNTTLTGTPPFNLTGELLLGTNVVDVFTQSFNNNTGDLIICLPSNIQMGQVNVQVTSLSDNHCTCN